jgi:hypothetical protein
VVQAAVRLLEVRFDDDVFAPPEERLGEEPLPDDVERVRLDRFEPLDERDEVERERFDFEPPEDRDDVERDPPLDERLAEPEGRPRDDELPPPFDDRDDEPDDRDDEPDDRDDEPRDDELPLSEFPPEPESGAGEPSTAASPRPPSFEILPRHSPEASPRSSTYSLKSLRSLRTRRLTDRNQFPTCSTNPCGR